MKSLAITNTLAYLVTIAVGKGKGFYFKLSNLTNSAEDSLGVEPETRKDHHHMDQRVELVKLL
jgi:hypothetical protein